MCVKNKTPLLVLASASPRRRMLLRQVGIPFTITVCDTAETADETLPPHVLVTVNAEAKARDARKQVEPSAVVVAADTVVCIDGRVLGKPSDETSAFDMLKMLQGRTHTVYTGVTLAGLRDGHEVMDSFVETADVRMRPLSDREIYAYIATGEPMDKAGAYGVQEKGAVLVERVEGDYHTVVGLPLARLCVALAAWGVDFTAGWAE